MTTEFKLPELGENIESGDVVNVLVREGERIEGNQGVVELETDKAVVEIPCPHAGTVAKIQVKKGDTVKVGQTILTIEADGEGQGAVAETTSPAPKEAAAAKAEPAPPEEETELPIRSQRPEATPISSQSTEPDSGEVIPAGPAARRIAREMGVDLQQVQGSGSRGRITPEDVRAAASGPAKTPQAARIAEEAAEPLASMEPVVPPGEPGQDAWGMVRRDRMSRVRKTISREFMGISLLWALGMHSSACGGATIRPLERWGK